MDQIMEESENDSEHNTEKSKAQVESVSTLKESIIQIVREV